MAHAVEHWCMHAGMATTLVSAVTKEFYKLAPINHQMEDLTLGLSGSPAKSTLVIRNKPWRGLTLFAYSLEG
jgi:hypothetical protein